MRADEITNFAHNACNLIELYQNVTESQARKIEALEKQANASTEVVKEVVKEVKINFDEAKLEKAANAVHDIFGKPSNYPAEAIAKFWKENPDAMTNTIHKLASKIAAMSTPVVENSEDEDLGRVVVKKASADDVTNLSETRNNDEAASSFWGNFK